AGTDERSAKGLRSTRRAAVRLLHAGLRRRLYRVCPQESQCHARPGARRGGGQPLPLRHLRRHDARRRRRVEERRGVNMAKVDWRAAEKRTLIGKRIDRIDGPLKATGAARYSYDINRPGMLWAKVVTSPYAHAEVSGIDTSAAEAMSGVKGVWRDTEKEVRYAGEIVAAVAAVTEEIAEEAARLVTVQYKPLEHQVVDTDPALSKDKPSKKDQGNVDEAFTKADKVVEGEYGIPVIAHCCLESHGQVTEVRDGELYVWPSTQNVSRYSDRLGDAAGVDQNKIHVECQFMGGGFGSKFNFD